MTEHMHIIGAGLCGSLLGLRLAQRGYAIQIYEKRPDPRLGEVDAGRSINLALSHRGLKALSAAGLDDDVRRLCIPMYGRRIHAIDGETRLARYSGRPQHYINSISRSELNLLMLTEADKHDHVDLIFNKACQTIDWHENLVTFEDGEILHFRCLFGTDGAGSRVRQSMDSYWPPNTFIQRSDFLTHGYKELTISANKNGSWQIDKHALHIWPRDNFMLIALPNLDGSFTVTLFLAMKGEESFEALEDDNALIQFFEKYFADALALMPDLIEEFRHNPIGLLGTVHSYPWAIENKGLILGDAAHAIVPFYGQGMNASFEDVTILEHYIDQYPDDWKTIFSSYQSDRKSDTDAIAELALDNYNEMRDHVDNPDFVMKREIEMKLERLYDDYYSKYSMVTFHPSMSYEEAMVRGRKQDEVLLSLINENDGASWSIEEIKKYLDQHV